MEMQEPSSTTDLPPGADSRFGYSSEWELFTLFPVDVSKEKSVYLTFSPVAPLKYGSPIEFNIMPNSMMYMDLKNIKLYLRVKITKLDGSNIGPNEEVSMVNYPIASLFRQVDLYLQQQIVCSSSTAYPYRAIIEALLESDWSDLNGPMKNGLLIKDDAGKMDSASLRGNVNSGFQDRADMASESREFELMGKLHIDLFRQHRYLLNNVQVTIKMSQTSEEFRLMRPEVPSPLVVDPRTVSMEDDAGDADDQAQPAGDTSSTASGAPAGGNSNTPSTPAQYRVEIVMAQLKVPMAKPTPAMMFGHERGLKKRPTVYPFERTEIKTAAIPAGMCQWPLENLFLSAQPKRLLVTLVPSAAFNGDYTRNPFNFHHFKVNYICLSIDGSCVPSQAFQPDYDNDFFLEAYDSLFSIAPDERIGRTRKITTIQREHYKNGYCMYLFNLDGGTQGSPYVQPQVIGLNKLDIRFAERLTEPVTVILYAVYNSVLEIDRVRNIRVFG